MQKLLKAIGILLATGLTGSILETWYKVSFVGNLFSNSSFFIQTLIVLLPIMVIVGLFQLTRWIIRFNPKNLKSDSLGIFVLLIGSSIIRPVAR